MNIAWTDASVDDRQSLIAFTVTLPKGRIKFVRKLKKRRDSHTSEFLALEALLLFLAKANIPQLTIYSDSDSLVESVLTKRKDKLNKRFVHRLRKLRTIIAEQNLKIKWRPRKLNLAHGLCSLKKSSVRSSVDKIYNPSILDSHPHLKPAIKTGTKVETKDNKQRITSENKVIDTKKLKVIKVKFTKYSIEESVFEKLHRGFKDKEDWNESLTLKTLSFRVLAGYMGRTQLKEKVIAYGGQLFLIKDRVIVSLGSGGKEFKKLWDSHKKDAKEVLSIKQKVGLIPTKDAAI